MEKEPQSKQVHIDLENRTPDKLFMSSKGICRLFESLRFSDS